MVVKAYRYEELRETFNFVSQMTSPAVSRAFDENYYGTDQRFGQAFFNALAICGMEGNLRGSVADPFYKDDVQSVYDALEFLTSSRGRW